MCDIILRALAGYADEMERGDVPMQTGPEALRNFGLMLDATLEANEDLGQ